MTPDQFDAPPDFSMLAIKEHQWKDPDLAACIQYIESGNVVPDDTQRARKIALYTVFY